MRLYLNNRERAQLRRVIKLSDEHARRVELPRPTETASVAIFTPKVAALCYDRVWSGLNVEVPPQIRFHTQAPVEDDTILVSTVGNFVIEHCQSTERTLLLLAVLRQLTENTLGFDITDTEVGAKMNRALAESIRKSYNLAVSATYATVAARDEQYAPGQQAALVAVLSHVAVPDESKLTWEQVVAFRNDAEMRMKLKRLTHWLDSSMVGKSWQFIEDEITIRLLDYENALRKHGLRTAVGTLATVLDSRTLLATAAATATATLTGGGIAGVATGTALLVGKAALSLAQTLLDFESVKSNTHPEIAFVAEVKTAAEASA